MDKVKSIGLKKFLQEIEQELLLLSLKENNNNITKAATVLKVNRTTLSEKLKRFKLKRT